MGMRKSHRIIYQVFSAQFPLILQFLFGWAHSYPALKEISVLA